MRKADTKKQLAERYDELNQVNFQYLSTSQMKSWLEKDSFIMDAETMVKIMLERNKFAKKNKELGSSLGGQRSANNHLKKTNSNLSSRINQLENILRESSKDLINWKKSEILNLFKKKYGKVTKEDNSLLREIGATSQETSINAINIIRNSMKEKVDKLEILAKGYENAKEDLENNN